MHISYEVHIADAFGSRLAVVGGFADVGGPGLEYVLSVGKIGALHLTLPTTFDTTLLKLDGRISVWRSINGAPPVLDGDAVYLIRRWRYTSRATMITALHATTLLQRRIVAYNAATTYTTKTAAAAGNQIKAFARENLGSGIVGASRDGVETQADISAYLTVQADLGDGASVAKTATRRNVFDVITELSQASLQAGTYLTAEIIAPTESTLELRTYAGQRGIDHTADSADPVILSEETGTLENAELIIDRTNEITVAVVGGAGIGALRTIATAVDTTRMGESPFNRCERFSDYPNITSATALQDEADAVLRESRPRISFSADLVETDGATRGIHYNLGDVVTASFRGNRYDVRLDIISVSVQANRTTTHVQLRTDS